MANDTAGTPTPDLPGRVSRALRPVAPPGAITERLGIIAKSLVAVAILVALKLYVHQQGWEPVSNLPILTSLMGGVVFTLAIILAGNLADFKESERIVGELAGLLRRMRVDLFLAVPDPERRRYGRRLLQDLARVLNENFARGFAWRMTDIYRPIDALDQLIAEAAGRGAQSGQTRTMQVWIADVVRIVNRIEVIIETTFMKAGYYLAGAVVAIAIGALTFTDLTPFKQGLFLYSFAVFLLLGLFLLIWDLDNPFAGHARLSVRQMQKVQAYLEADHQD